MEAIVRDANDYAWLPPEVEATAESVPELIWRNRPDLIEAAAAAVTADDADGIDVVINHGRWIAECPTCKDAQLASRTDLRFMCVSCANSAIGGAWRPVRWPVEQAAIEEALTVRPDVSAQNWTPDETAADLTEQNTEAGI